MSRAATENAPTSLNNCSPVGIPNRSRATCSPHHSRSGFHRSDGALLPMSTKAVMAIKVATRLIKVAQPAPARPKAGEPRWPKIRIQLSNTLSKTPPNMIQNAGHGRDWLSK